MLTEDKAVKSATRTYGGTAREVPDKSGAGERWTDKGQAPRGDAVFQGRQADLLNAALRHGTIAYGRVADVAEMVSDGERTAALTVLCGGGARVRIPFREIYRDYPIDMDTVDTLTQQGRKVFLARQRAMAEKLIGLQTPFTVGKTEGEGPDGEISLTGSRRDALIILERDNYESGEGNLAAIEEGDEVNAKIISAGRWSVQVNAGGIDTIIRLGSLTYSYVPGSDSVRNMYRVDETIPVDIIRITVREDGFRDIVVSAKTAELRRAKMRERTAKPEAGAHCVATVTSVRQNRDRSRGLILTMMIEGYEFPAVAAVRPQNIGQYPRQGDRIRVTVMDYAENGMCYVRCRQVQGPVGPFIPR